MTTLAGTSYRRTVGVAGEPTVGRATALVAVVMCLAAVSETSDGASNSQGGSMPEGGDRRRGELQLNIMLIIGT